MGVGAYYTDRRSNVAALGVEGLSFGVIFNYAGPVKVAFRPEGAALANRAAC